MIIRIDTQRLLLRPFTEADLDDLAALHGDSSVMRYIDDGRPVPAEVVAAKTLPGILRQYTELPSGLGSRAIIEKATGDFVGWVSLAPASSVGLSVDLSVDFTVGSAAGLELGYRLRPTKWGTGYASEAARAVVDFAFGQLGAERIVATTMTVNVGSRRVMEKAGLHHVRTFFEEWPTYIPGAEHGDVEYALTRSDWLGLG